MLYFITDKENNKKYTFKLKLYFLDFVILALIVFGSICYNHLDGLVWFWFMGSGRVIK